MSNTNQIVNRKSSAWLRIASLSILLLATIGVVAFISISFGSPNPQPTNDQLNSAPVAPTTTGKPIGKPTSNLPTYTPIILPTFNTLPGDGRPTSTHWTGDVIITLPPFNTLPGDGRPTSTPRTSDTVITVPPFNTLPGNR